jgi:hypothetical protein
LHYRDRGPTLEIVEAGRPWSFDGDSALFRLLSESPDGVKSRRSQKRLIRVSGRIVPQCTLNYRI